MINDVKVLVTGAGGFIGKDLVERLLNKGWHVKAMIRKPITPSFPKPENLEIVYADMRDASSLRVAIQNVKAIVHLAAAKADEIDSEDINVEGAKRLIAECNAAGCSRIINISSQSAKIRHKGTYARTKNLADRIFHNSGLQVTTLMPSIVYGKEMKGVFGTIVKFAQTLPLIPVLGNGKWVSAPIYVEDVSKAIVSCIEHENTIGKIYDLAGPDFITFDDLIDKICEKMGIRRLKLHIPFSVALIIAKFVAKISSQPPITVSNVLGSNQDTKIDINPARKDFGFEPIDLATGFRIIFENIQKNIEQKSAGENESKYNLSNRERLKLESVLISKYLIDCIPPKELTERYVNANLILLGNQDHVMKNPELRFIYRYPFVLPFIDAAAGILSPNSIIRKKILIMSAIIEATPTFSDFFLRKPDPLLKLLIILGWHGLKGVAKTIFGIPMFIWSRRGHLL